MWAALPAQSAPQRERAFGSRQSSMEHRRGNGNVGDDNTDREGNGRRIDTEYRSQENGYIGGTSNGNRHGGGVVGLEGEGSTFGEAGSGRSGFNGGGSAGYMREGRFYSGGASTSSRQRLTTQSLQTTQGNQDKSAQTSSNNESRGGEDWQEALLSAIGRLPQNGS